ncbi:MAG: nitronate monooxygenase [Thermoproteota archaeon]|nr:nitronate monooxygenase [Thermoproteota archaeon]
MTLPNGNWSESNLLCKTLNIDYPIIQAGMAGITTPELVSAVSNEGGLGVLGASKLSPEQLLDSIRKIRKNTSRPYGVNLILAPPENPEPNAQSTYQEIQLFLDNKLRRPMGLPPKIKTEMSDSHLGIKEAGHDDSPLHKSLHLPPLPSPIFEDQLKIILEEKVPVVSFAMGNLRTLIDKVHSNGSKVMSMVTSVEEAVEVSSNGSDVIIAQGSEAGGHRSTFNIRKWPNGVPLVGTMTLVSQIVDALRNTKETNKTNDTIMPIVAAGGIGDGRGLVAAMALGASGVAIGTRFIVCRESAAFHSYKERLLSSKETDTIVTNVFSGRPARAVRNKLTEEYLNSTIKPLSWPYQGMISEDIYANAIATDNADYYPLLAGQGLRMLKRNQGAGEIVREIITEAKESLALMEKTLNQAS